MSAETESGRTRALRDALRQQRDAWARGDKLPAESLFAQFPVLRQDEESAVQLVYDEFLLRANLGEHPDPQEFLQRFPDLAPRLKLQFDFHAALQGAPRNEGSTSFASGELEPEFEGTSRFSVVRKLG